jgi:hypothetical protein
MERESALQFGIGLAAFSVGIMGVAVNWLSAGILGLLDLLLRRRLYDVAEAQHAAEYRDRWRGRRIPAGDRLGCGDGRCDALPQC